MLPSIQPAPPTDASVLGLQASKPARGLKNPRSRLHSRKRDVSIGIGRQLHKSVCACPLQTWKPEKYLRPARQAVHKTCAHDPPGEALPIPYQAAAHHPQQISSLFSPRLLTLPVASSYQFATPRGLSSSTASISSTPLDTIFRPVTEYACGTHFAPGDLHSISVAQDQVALFFDHSQDTLRPQSPVPPTKTQ